MLQCLKFCYKLENNLLPDYFINGNIFTRQSNVHSHTTRGMDNYALPRVSHEFAKNSPRFKIPFIFNEMSHDIKSKIYTHSICGFKLYAKTKLISLYETECVDVNCFSCRH